VRHRSAPFCARTSPQRPQAREQRARDLESLVTRLLAAHGPARASIPVVGVTQVAFDAVQPGADPRAFGVVLRLRELVRGRPVAVQAVPDGAQHWRRTGAGSLRPRLRMNESMATVIARFRAIVVRSRDSREPSALAEHEHGQRNSRQHADADQRPADAPARVGAEPVSNQQGDAGG